MGDNGLMRILVVEDDDQIASFVAKGLKQSGYAVDHCADGEEALTLATTTPYDAAVVDIQLPKLDGLSLVQRLRRQNNRLPVLFLSAKASVDDRVKGLEAGDYAQQGRLPATGRPDEREAMRAVELEAHAVEHRVGVEALGHIAQAKFHT